MNRWFQAFRTDKPTHPFRVGFLIAGVQKAGTFSMFRLLEQHPQIALSRTKEVHFFDDEINVDWTEPDYSRYHQWFSGRGDNIYGEASPIYLYWPPALTRIKAYNPDIKLVLLFRDPIGRAYSAWCHQRRKGREKLLFSEAIREGRTRIQGNLSDEKRHFSYVERGLYAEQLRRALDLFPPSSILSLDSQQLSLSPSTVLKTVAKFLNISAPSRDPVAVHANQRSPDVPVNPPSPEDISLLVDLIGTDLENFETMVSFGLERWTTWRVMRGLTSAEDASLEFSEPGFGVTGSVNHGSEQEGESRKHTSVAGIVGPSGKA
jgi:Sulfotransferase domain